MIWEKALMAAGIQEQDVHSGPKKCCSNYRLHYEFVIRCLGALQPAFHAAVEEAASCFFPCILILAGGYCG